MLLVLGACGGDRPAASREAARSTCSPLAAHPKHATATCTTCHACDGVVAFDPAGLAVMPGQPAPTFDAATKTCANVACHGVRAGTFSYFMPDGQGEAELRTFDYGSTPQPTPSWLTTGIGCAGCHGNPPRNGYWHSGSHALQGPTGTVNQCQLCHPDATGSNGVGTAITNPALHGNGVVDVQPRYKSSCFGCH